MVNKFITRKFELQQKKPGKEIILDDTLTAKEQNDYNCSTRTELELFQSMRRVHLHLISLVCADMKVFNAYHSELLQHLQKDPPPVQ